MPGLQPACGGLCGPGPGPGVGEAPGGAISQPCPSPDPLFLPLPNHPPGSGRLVPRCRVGFVASTHRFSNKNGLSPRLLILGEPRSVSSRDRAVAPTGICGRRTRSCRPLPPQDGTRGLSTFRPDLTHCLQRGKRGAAEPPPPSPASAHPAQRWRHQAGPIPRG